MRMDCRLTIFALVVFLPLTLLGYFRTLKPYQTSSKAKGASTRESVQQEYIIDDHNALTISSPVTIESTARINEEGVNQQPISSFNPKLKYHILAPPEYTDDLLKDERGIANTYYPSALNEESAEIWLHRAFLSQQEGQTLDAAEADVFLIAGYLHLNLATPRPQWQNQTVLIQRYKDMIVDKSKPHLILTATWNPGRSRLTGVGPLAVALEKDGVNIYSVGIERNKSWQGLLPSRIIPIPYVVKQSLDQRNDQSSLTSKVENSVFYTGDARQNAQAWGGCFREKMILPLVNTSLPNIDVRIVHKRTRMPQAEYNHRMITSEFCLILCGDTPTSRSLTSAMVSGCIPIFVGSRLRGLCEPPCEAKFGWSVPGADYPHLAFPNRIPWNKFPEVSESEFILHGESMLKQVFAQNDKTAKEELRTIMTAVREGWIYGWGDPVTSTNFGQVHKYLWEEFERLVQ